MLLAQVAPHQVCELRAVLQLLVHHLQRSGRRSRPCREGERSGGGVTHVDSAVDAEELTRLFVELLQVFSVPVEVRSDEQVGPQVYAVSVTEGQHEDNRDPRVQVDLRVQQVPNI